MAAYRWGLSGPGRGDGIAAAATLARRGASARGVGAVRADATPSTRSPVDAMPRRNTTAQK